MIPATLTRRFPFFLIGLVLLVPGFLLAVGLIQPPYFVAGFAAAVFLAIFMVNFEAGFLTLIFVRSSLDYFKLLTRGGSFNVAAVAGAFLILLGIFYILYRRINIFAYAETRPFLIFLGVCGVSVFFSSNRFESLSDWLRLVSIFFVYVFARHVTVDAKKRRSVLFLVLLSAGVPVLVAFIQLFFGVGLRHGRLVGTFYHPNAFASYLLVILVFVLAQILERHSTLPRSLLIPFAGFAFVAFVLTLSRGAWIVFLFVMGVMGFLRYRRILGWMPALLPLLVFLPGVMGRIKDVTESSYHRGRSAWQWRLDAWKELVPLIREKPIFGHGIAMVNVQLGYMAHNDYLRLAVEVGLVGLLAYIFLMTGLLRLTWRDYQSARSGMGKSIQLGLLAITLGFLVREIADNTLRNTVVLLYFWIFVAMARNAAIDEAAGREV